MVVRNAFGELAQEHTNAHGDAHLISGNKKKWRREFNSPTADNWDLVLGGSIAIGDPSGGILTVNMGTTANAESSMVSKESFTFPLRIAVGIQLSQKIANNEVYVELVGLDSQGNLDETRVAAWRLAGSDSTTATVARSEVRNGAAARRQSGNLTTVAQTGAPCMLEITAESDEIWFASKLTDSVAARTVANVMNLVAPDPELEYKLRLRFKNGATAPASATTVSLFFALAVDYTEQQIEVTGGNGNTQAAQSIPVSVVNGGGVTSPSIAASASVTGIGVTKINSAASTNGAAVKGSAARLYGYQLANMTASWKFLRLYNQAAAPTVGTTVPFMVVPLPPNSAIDLNMTIPITFSAGLGMAITGAAADLDATAIGAGEVIGSLLWV